MDGAQFFFTDHDRDIVFNGDTYRADAGFERTAIRSDAGFAVDNLDLVGVFAEGGIVEDEVRAGLFDGAEIRVSFVSWEDPDGHGEIRLRRGTLGETRLTPQGYFHAELRGLSQPLAQSTLAVFSPNCRADLGDARCKFPIEPPELERDQAVSEGAFYRVPTAAGTGSARYEDRIYEVIEAGTTASSQPAYDTTIGATTTDGSAQLKAHDSFTRVTSVEAVTDHRIFTVSDELSGFADGWFDEGAVTFETGANAGGTIEVKSWALSIRRLELWGPTGLPVARQAVTADADPIDPPTENLREAGTPQGSPLSPLLSNILLDDLDKELERRGHQFCRYADDMNIYVKSKRAGDRVMASVTHFLEVKLRLRVNRDKSTVDRPWKRRFLGYTVTDHRSPRLKPAPSSVNRAKDRIREITQKGRGRNILKVIQEITQYLRGWFGYFRLSTVKQPFELLDQWIRRRLRKILWEQWRHPRTRYRRLVALGLWAERARKATATGRRAWWNAGASHMHAAIPKRLLAQWGLLSLLEQVSAR